ncbi:MAG: deoxyribonuclease IV [Clostridia bacterium]|nr:deoxyribonuclease IV [Clostridia bacterium]
MLNIGCHLSISGGYAKMGQTAAKINANTFAFFTRNPRGGSRSVPDPADMEALRLFLIEKAFAPLVAHAPYTLNLCSDKENIREYAEQVMTEDLRLLDALPGNYYNFHPGCHMRQGTEAGIRMISDALNRIMQPERKTVMLLETMAGKGSEVGGTFEELRAILNRLELEDRFGVCLDTCHIFDAGYDIVGHLEDVLDEFERVIGMDKLLAIHLNDSKNPIGSHKDRHEKIGKGEIGLDALAAVITHPSLRKLPFILETPNELDGYAEEIALLRRIYEPGRHQPASASGSPADPAAHLAEHDAGDESHRQTGGDRQ